MKSRVLISIESFESIVNYHEDPEEVIFRDHRAYLDMRFGELVHEIGLIKEKLGITIERSESAIDLYEARWSCEYREFDEVRFDELVREIGLIKEKFGITIESIEPVIGFPEKPEEAMPDEHPTDADTEFNEHQAYVEIRFGELVREIGLIKEHLGT